MKKAALGISTFCAFLISVITIAGFFHHPRMEFPSDLKGVYVAVRNNKIRVYQTGKGPDILMIHGCPGSLEDWEPIIEKLSKKYRVTTYDRPGQGYSTSNGYHFNLVESADFAFAMIEALKLKNPLIVGHSYGSATALAMAVRQPKNVKAFVLLASPGYPHVDVGFMNYLLYIPYFGKGFVKIFGGWVGPIAIRAGIENSLGPNRDLATADFVNPRVNIWLDPGVLTARAKEMVHLEKNLADLNRFYKEISAKVMILQGKEDTITKAAWKLSEDIPNARLTVYDNTGHYIQYAKPDQVVEKIEQVMKE